MRHCLQTSATTHLVRILSIFIAQLGIFSRGGEAADLSNQPGIMKREFIFTEAPFAQCHASTIEEGETGLVASWFAGTREGNPDVGIWVSRHVDGAWTPPLEVADGVQTPSERHPCWNPVLFQPKRGPLLLFYKCGPSPKTWWGMLMRSTDGGKSWDKPQRLPEGIAGPIKNKPIERADGTLVCPSSTEDEGWRVHFEITKDLGKTWSRVGPVNDGKTFGAIQPSLLTHTDGRMQALCRSRQRAVTEVWSSDGGHTWSSMKASALPNPNSGIDAVTLEDNRQLLVYNHTRLGRSPINVAVSKRDGVLWEAALVLEDEPGEYSYPAVIQTRDGLVHATYTWKRRRMRHVVIDPRQLQLRPMRDGEWPSD